MRNSFVKNVISLMLGSGVSQIIAVVSIPFLTYLYSPAEFGEYALFLALITLISVFASGRYELAIMLPRSKESSINIFYLTQIINFSVTFIVTILLFMLKNNGLNLFGIELNDISILLTSCAIFFFTGNQCIIYLANKFDKFNEISISRILNSLLTAGFSLIFFELGSTGMLLGFVLGNLLSLTNIFWTLRFDFIHGNTKLIVESIKKYKEFPQKSLLSGLLNIGTTQVPVLLITTFFGTTLSGYYSLSMRILNAPMSFIGKAFSQVYFNKMSKISNEKKLKLFNKTTLILTGMIVPIMAILFLLSDYIYINVFGEEWLYSSFITKVLIPFFIIRFVFSSQSSILIVERSLTFELKFNILNFALQISVVGFTNYLSINPNYIFIQLSILGSILYLYLGVYMFKKIKGLKNEKSS